MSDWRELGNYTGDECKNCGRQRVIAAEDPAGRARKVCEKCHWDQESCEYAEEGPDQEGRS